MVWSAIPATAQGRSFWRLRSNKGADAKKKKKKPSDELEDRCVGVEALTDNGGKSHTASVTCNVLYPSLYLMKAKTLHAEKSFLQLMDRVQDFPLFSHLCRISEFGMVSR